MECEQSDLSSSWMLSILIFDLWMWAICQKVLVVHVRSSTVEYCCSLWHRFDSQFTCYWFEILQPVFIWKSPSLILLSHISSRHFDLHALTCYSTRTVHTDKQESISSWTLSFLLVDKVVKLCWECFIDPVKSLGGEISSSLPFLMYSIQFSV